MASAKRLTVVRHGCLNSSSAAEMSVPAWPMPIHHTKLTMGIPQATGMLLPKMPMPVVMSLTTDTRYTMSTIALMVKPIHHHVGVLPKPARTGVLTRSSMPA